MFDKNVTKHIYEYIVNNNISLSQINEYTGISVDEIISEGRKLNATELLSLCEYLNIQPNRFVDTGNPERRLK